MYIQTKVDSFREFHDIQGYDQRASVTLCIRIMDFYNKNFNIAQALVNFIYQVVD